MRDNSEIPGFGNFLLSADEIRSSVNVVLEDGIKYNVQSNVARCLLSVNENKAMGEALVKIGLEETITSTWGPEFLFDVKTKIYGEKAIKSQPESFENAFNQPDIFLTVLADTIDEIVERGFVCVISNQFGLHPRFLEDTGMSFAALHFPSDDNSNTKSVLENLFHTLRRQAENIMMSGEEEYNSLELMIWGKEHGNLMPHNWNMILAPNLDLVIDWRL